jgi:hypothetical protein
MSYVAVVQEHAVPSSSRPGATRPIDVEVHVLIFDLDMELLVASPINERYDGV